MRGNRYIFPIALGGSLAIHLASMGAWCAWSAAHRGRARQRPLELVVSLDDSFDRNGEMGDARGVGIGADSSPGEKPLVAPEADQDQALLSRDPVGMGRLVSQPTDYTGPSGNGAGGSPAIQEDQSPAVASASPAAQVDPVPVVEPMPEGKIPVAQPSPEVAVVMPPVEIPKPSVKQTSTAVAKVKATGDGRSPGLPQRSADSLPQSESDSDPFSRISGSVTVREGRLDVRLGRKVKTTRPQLLLAGQVDLFALSNPTVVLEVHIAPGGNVTDVKIAHSSGSNQVDEPTRLAVYNWWFEPARNKAGQAIADVVFFTVQYR